MRPKKTSIEIPRNSPGSVIGRKKSSDVGPRSRGRMRVRPYAAAVPSSSVAAATTAATIAEFCERLAELERREDVAVPAQGEPLEGERERPGLVEREEHDDDERNEEEDQRENEDRRRERAPLGAPAPAPPRRSECGRA